MHCFKRVLLSLIVLALFSFLAYCDDAAPSWPRFHGPRNNNRSEDTGLLKAWPEEGPELVWKAEGLGGGYGSVSLADGRIYVAGNVDESTMISALDLDGELLWQASNGPAYTRSFPGARSTPTYDIGRVYHMNADGDVVCLNAENGERIWGLNILDKFDGRNIGWALSESLLIDGDRVICTPGGEETGLVALDKLTGETIWTCTGIEGERLNDDGEKESFVDSPGYCSPCIVEYGGLRQIVTMMSASAVGVNTETGELLWRFPRPAPYDVNVGTPLYHDGHLLIHTTWGVGATKLKLNIEGQKCGVEEVWSAVEFDNEHGGIVLHEGHVYGHADGDHKWRHWTCIDWETGEKTYDADPFPRQRSGVTTYADGMLYIMSEDGRVGLVPAVPDEFKVVSEFMLPEVGREKTWSHPVIVGGRLYIRNWNDLYVYDVAAE
jgi:outer membrane protein assembly factor BamB